LVYIARGISALFQHARAEQHPNHDYASDERSLEALSTNNIIDSGHNIIADFAPRHT
jgi:hypothetical protein